jgi:hypothetical protein
MPGLPSLGERETLALLQEISDAFADQEGADSPTGP